MKKLQICLLALMGTVLWVACEQTPPGPYPPEEILIPLDGDDPGDSNKFI